MVTLFVTVTVPNPPESRASISPLLSVFEMAPAKVLQGAVRLHGLRSSPTPDTQVLVWACAAAESDRMKSAHVRALTVAERVLIVLLSPSKVFHYGWHGRGPRRVGGVRP